jgi:hypothetical protein
MCWSHDSQESNLGCSMYNQKDLGGELTAWAVEIQGPSTDLAAILVIEWMSDVSGTKALHS